MSIRQTNGPRAAAIPPRNEVADGAPTASELLPPPSTLPPPVLPSASFLHEREAERFRETRERAEMTIRRESSFAKLSEETRASTGLFGQFHRALTLSDPYEIEIQRSRQAVSTARYGQSLIDAAEHETNPAKRLELLNSARRLYGMREATEQWGESDTPPPVRPSGKLDSSHFALEDRAIDVSRDVAVYTTVTVGTLGASVYSSAAAKGAQGVGAVVHTTLREAAVRGAVYGGTQSAVESGVIAVDDVHERKRTAGEAAVDVAVSTGRGAVFGAAFGAVFNRIGRLIGLLRPRSGGSAPASTPNEGPPPEGALAVDGDEIQRILSSPSIEAERNAVMRNPTAVLREPVGAGARSASGGSAGGRASSAPRNSASTGSSSGAGSEPPAESSVSTSGAAGASSGGAPVQKLDELRKRLDDLIRQEYLANEAERNARKTLSTWEDMAGEGGKGWSKDIASQTEIFERAHERAMEIRAARIKFLSEHPELKLEFPKRTRDVGAKLKEPGPQAIDTSALKKRIQERGELVEAEIDKLLDLKQRRGLTVAESDRLADFYDAKAAGGKYLDRIRKLRDTEADRKILAEIERQYPPGTSAP